MPPDVAQVRPIGRIRARISPRVEVLRGVGVHIDQGARRRERREVALQRAALVGNELAYLGCQGLGLLFRLGCGTAVCLAASIATRPATAAPLEAVVAVDIGAELVIRRAA